MGRGAPLDTGGTSGMKGCPLFNRCCGGCIAEGLQVIEAELWGARVMDVDGPNRQISATPSPPPPATLYPPAMAAPSPPARTHFRNHFQSYLNCTKCVPWGGADGVSPPGGGGGWGP